MRDSEPTPGSSTPARVILIVGDGMGLAHWTAAAMSQDSPTAVSRLPVMGLVDTRCACTRTTDSGAAATAYATGFRTQYTFISMTPDSMPLTTVLELAEAKGMATGLVTTTEITDATPAAFAAHVPSRYNRMDIAAQMSAKEIEVLLGGGRIYFSMRPDGRDLLRTLADNYAVVRTPDQFRQLDFRNVDKLVGLFADSTIFPATHLRPGLPEMALAALQILDRDPDGFFLLLENEDTDDLAHRNRPIEELVSGISELDRTIATALEFQRRRPQTLIVVVGDHETGGLTLQVPRDAPLTAVWRTTGHSASMVPVFAGGPGANAFGRWLRNDELGQLLFRAIGSVVPKPTR
jgi:alkaline phosphatase